VPALFFGAMIRSGIIDMADDGDGKRLGLFVHVFFVACFLAIAGMVAWNYVRPIWGAGLLIALIAGNLAFTWSRTGTSP
jgi:hypothetical protein